MRLDQCRSDQEFLNLFLFSVLDVFSVALTGYSVLYYRNPLLLPRGFGGFGSGLFWRLWCLPGGAFLGYRLAERLALGFSGVGMPSWGLRLATGLERPGNGRHKKSPWRLNQGLVGLAAGRRFTCRRGWPLRPFGARRGPVRSGRRGPGYSSDSAVPRDVWP